MAEGKSVRLSVFCQPVGRYVIDDGGDGMRSSVREQQERLNVSGLVPDHPCTPLWNTSGVQRMLWMDPRQPRHPDRKGFHHSRGVPWMRRMRPSRASMRLKSRYVKS